LGVFSWPIRFLGPNIQILAAIVFNLILSVWVFQITCFVKINREQAQYILRRLKELLDQTSVLKIYSANNSLAHTWATAAAYL